jgi:hypothetical protein
MNADFGPAGHFNDGVLGGAVLVRRFDDALKEVERRPL